MRQIKGRRLSSLFLVLLLVFLTLPAAASPLSFYGRLDSFTYSAPVTIDAARNKWETNDFERGENQWSSHWLEAGLVYKKWRLGYIQRLEVDLNFSKDTAEYYYRTENDLPLEPGKTYQLYLRAQKVQLEGFRFGRNHRFGDNVQLDWGISYLQADDLIDGDIQGDQSQLSLDYHYSEDTLLDRVVDRPDGEGFSIDLSASWEINENTRVSARAEDLVNRIYWRDAPYTTAEASADQNTYNDDGILVVKPLVTGFEGTDKRYTQELDTKLRLDLFHRLNKAELNLTYMDRSKTQLWGLGSQFDMTDQLKLGFRIWPELESLELYTRWQRLLFSVAADSTDWDDMNAVWLQIHYQ